MSQSLLFNKAAAAFDENQKQESNFQEVDGLVTKELLFFVHSRSPSRIQQNFRNEFAFMLSLFLLKFHFSSRYLGSGKQFSVFTCRSSHRRCGVKIGVLGNFAKVTGKHLCHSLFFNKVAGLRSANLLKMSLWHRYFPVNFAKFLRTLFLTDHLWWPFLQIFRTLMVWWQKNFVCSESPSTLEASWIQ